MAEKLESLKLYAGAILAMAALFLPVYVFAISEYNVLDFVGSQQFMEDYGWSIFWGTLIAACGFVGVIFGGEVIAAYRARPHVPHNKDFRAIMWVLGCWLVLYVFCMSQVPLLSSFFFAVRVETTWTVQKIIVGGRHEYCHRGITISGPSRWNRKLCRLDRDLYDRISPGDEIVVTGRGNYFGIRVKCIEPVQADGKDCSSP